MKYHTYLQPLQNMNDYISRQFIRPELTNRSICFHTSEAALHRCSENMQQIYKRTRMPKFDFNKAALQLCWNHTSAWVFSWKFVAYFQKTFSWERLWKAASATCFSLWLIHCANTLEYICCQIKTYEVLRGFPQNKQQFNTQIC